MKLRTRALWLASAAALAANVAAEQTSGAVTLYASVTDENGRMAGNLSTSDFVLEVDGKAREVTVALDSSPGAFILLLDRSGSMTELLDQIADLANAIVVGLPPGARARLAQAIPQVQIHPPEPLPDQRNVAEAIRHLPVEGKTALWDAAVASIRALDGITGYKSIVIVSDGDDTQSRARAPQVVQLAQSAGVIAHGIFLAADRPISVAGRADAAPLRQVVEETGGVYWPVRSAKDPAALGAEVAKTVSTRYAITFDQPADGKFHNLKLRTPNGKLKVAVAKKFKS